MEGGDLEGTRLLDMPARLRLLGGGKRGKRSWSLLYSLLKNMSADREAGDRL